MEQDRAAIPLTVVGGFLGAGKTSLVNHLLRTATRRVGVLVNDFGALDVDAALIEAADGASIALRNGCICCSMGDDFADALAMMAARQPRPQAVIVEASGVSDPWRIAQHGLAEPDFSLEPLVVVVDAAVILEQLVDPRMQATIRQQLAFAELMVLNKRDLCADLPAVEAALRDIRPQARLIAAGRGEVDPEALQFVPPARSTSRLHADAGPHGFVSAFWPCPAPLDARKLRRALEDLPRAVLRVKGACTLGVGAAPQLLQYAAERWAFTTAPAGLAPGLVLIGTADMPAPEVLFASCVLP